ncbi:MAG: dihydroorotate dehydrogenase [Firmicutes bacterium]|nr:dihydroorotate dehydrogenase [Bacillota bacterium]
MSKLLQRKVFGLEFKNPIIPASGCFNMGKEVDANFFPIKIFGGLMSKGITRANRLGNPAPRVAETASGMLNAVGLQNPGVDHFIKHDLPFLKKQGSPVFANACGNTVDDYLYVVGQLEKTNIDAIELNVSCPNVKMGLSFGTDAGAVEEVVSAVRKITKKPLVVKLTPNVTSPALIAKAAENAGADGISLINTLGGMAVDIKTRKPVLGNRAGGLSGAAVKPVALKMVHDVYKAVKIPVIGLGGIQNYKDIIEFMLVGATLVQVGTTLMTDPMSIPQMIADLENWCKENKIKNLDEIVGGLL